MGYYGDTGDRTADEKTPPLSDGFLVEVCQDWEAATVPATDAGIRVVMLRTGLPLHRDGGLLRPLLLPARLGLLGRLGDGRQYWPWISLPDWLGAVRFLLDRDDLAGPVNLTGPTPVTNAEFTAALGRVLGRPRCCRYPDSRCGWRSASSPAKRWPVSGWCRRPWSRPGTPSPTGTRSRRCAPRSPADEPRRPANLDQAGRPGADARAGRVSTRCRRPPRYPPRPGAGCDW